MRSFISLQSYNIFTSLAETLVLLIIAHRDYYTDYPLLPWEHGTEALEHVFGIARQLVPDFTAYKFFKVLIISAICSCLSVLYLITNHMCI